MDATDRLGSSSGLFPQNMLEILLAHEVNRVRRYPSPVSLLQLSIQFPHDSSAQFMESAKAMVVHLLNSRLRESDLPGQYGGNYLVILPATNAAGARIAAERLLDAIYGSQPFRDAGSFETSINIGLASHPGGAGISMFQMVSDVFTALVEARQRGLRSIVAFGEIQGKPAKPGC